MNWFQKTFFGKGDGKLWDSFRPFRFWGASPVFNDYKADVEKIEAVFSNPALLKVISLQCDLFSLAKIYVYNKKGKLIENDPAIKRFDNPNPMQSRSQFLWDYMFWKMIGNAYLYMDSNIVTRENAPMYWLDPSKIDWPVTLERLKDKLVFSDTRRNEILKTEITYKYEDGSTFKFMLGKLSTIQDLSNGTGNWFKGFSRIDALYKVITNSEASLNSKNINVRYSGKFLVAGTTNVDDVTRTPMLKGEKESIENRIDSDEKNVHAIKSMIDIKRFVDDMKAMQLDQSFLADYFLIGNIYNIPRDVLEAYQSSTFENQEKARAGHVSYTLEPAGEALAYETAKRWGYTDKGKTISLSWDHLPFVQVFEKDRVIIQNQKADIFIKLLKTGMTVEEINIFLDTEFQLKGEDNGDTAAENGQNDTGEEGNGLFGEQTDGEETDPGGSETATGS